MSADKTNPINIRVSTEILNQIDRRVPDRRLCREQLVMDVVLRASLASPLSTAIWDTVMRFAIQNTEVFFSNRWFWPFMGLLGGAGEEQRIVPIVAGELKVRLYKVLKRIRLTK